LDLKQEIQITFVIVRWLQDFPLNPKALSLGELYGEFDLNTNEWTDGVLSSVMRQTCAGENSLPFTFATCHLITNHILLTFFFLLFTTQLLSAQANLMIRFIAKLSGHEATLIECFAFIPCYYSMCLK
jgi:hypothetical protein